MRKISVMFLCSGRFCLSQMAEGWARLLMSQRFDIRAASLKPQPTHFMAITAMAENEIVLSDSAAIRINREMLEWADVLVTFSERETEHHDMLQNGPKHIRLRCPLENMMIQDGDSQLGLFRAYRDVIKQQIEQVLLRHLERGLASAA